MEFKFNVNDILPDPICLVDDKLAPFARRHRYDRMALSSKQADLKKIIDLMGEASTKAQNLRSPITSATKLLHSDHRLYISKDPNANNGLGAVVGIIKIGHKKLFIQDYQGVQYEVNPLCVLDFYIHESRQRTGCGRTIFDHMLKVEGVSVEQLAIDKPSHKFLSFLRKHYNLDKPIPQVNNFVIFAGFFHDLQAVGLVPRRGQRFSSSNRNQTPLHPYKRQSNENNAHVLNKRKSMNCQSPLNQPSSSLQPDEQENALQVQPMETSSSTTDTDRVIPSSTEVSHQDISLPPIVTRPPGRHSASRAQVGSSGPRWVLESSLASEIPTSRAFNAERGLAARATAYSRYNSSRENSAPVIRTTKETARGKLDSFERISSGGRKRNLHLTSAGNPLQIETQQQLTPLNNAQPVGIKPQMDMNANEAANSSVNPNYLSSTGNYSISQMYNTFYGQQRPLGTGWNVFGVPSGAGMLPPRKSTSRTFPY